MTKTAYQVEIVHRALGNDKKKIEEFNELYEGAKKHGSYITEQTPQEKKIAGEFKRGISKTRLAKDYKITHWQVDTAIRRVFFHQ